MTEPVLVERRHGTLRVFVAERLVEAVLPTGERVTFAEGDGPVGREEAADLGYLGSDAVWRSLLDRHLTHVLMAEWMGWGPSLVLLHEAGARRVTAGKRRYEEALVLSFQRWNNTADLWPALEPWTNRLALWALDFQGVRQVIPA